MKINYLKDSQMDQDSKVLVYFLLFASFFIFIVVISSQIHSYRDNQFKLKSMEMGYEQVIDNGYKVWKKTNEQNTKRK